jgi:hypothetical protein
VEYAVAEALEARRSAKTLSDPVAARTRLWQFSRPPPRRSLSQSPLRAHTENRQTPCIPLPIATCPLLYGGMDNMGLAIVHPRGNVTSPGNNTALVTLSLSAYRMHCIDRQCTGWQLHTTHISIRPGRTCLQPLLVSYNPPNSYPNLAELLPSPLLRFSS